MNIADDYAAIRARLGKTESLSDPVVALVAERFRLEAECEAGADDDLDQRVDQTGERIARLDDEIAGTIATSAAGVIGQVRVLHELGWGTFDDNDVHHAPDCADRLIASIAAGVERLEATQPPAR